MASTEEEQDLKEAIKASLISAGTRAQTAEQTDSSDRLGTEPIARIDDYVPVTLESSTLPLHLQPQIMQDVPYRQRIAIQRYKMHFTEVEFNEGDTLVFVDFPEPSKGDIPVDCEGAPFRSQKFRVHSERLLATGSSKFAEMLQPTYQFRIFRRRELVKKLPEGVKYVLDMTPPPEGDEMVFQVTELSLTPGIIKWWSSYARLNAPFYLVKGHDDVCPCRRLANCFTTAASTKPAAVRDSQARPAKATNSALKLPLTVSELVLARNRGQERQVEDVPTHFNIPDYCPIRHRNGIIRLLMLIEDKEVFIDSASRLWTIVALAKIWDCVSAVQDPVIQWMLQGKNSKFIEVLPEEAIKIGGIIENSQITQTAFRVLVNELAFEQTASDEMKQKMDFNHVTFFGRRKGDPGDEFSNLIQHATLALVERIGKRLTEFQGHDVFTSWDYPENPTLVKIEEALASASAESCKEALKLIMDLKTQLKLELNNDGQEKCRRHHLLPTVDQKQIDADRATYTEPQDFSEFRDIYRTMTPIQKLMTCYPYKQPESFTTWADGSLVENSSFSPAKFTICLGKELAELYDRYKDRHPWNGKISSKFMHALSEEWRDAQSCSHPFGQRNLDLRGRWKPEKTAENDLELQLMHTKHLLYTLTSNETKFLPLWAGGCNDGTGGVFEDPLPPADMGPSGPGPAYRTGLTIPSAASSLSGSFVEDMAETRLVGSTTAASVDVHDGAASTVYGHDQVIADDASVAAETFDSDLSDYHEAREVIGAPGQSSREDTVPQSFDYFLLAADGGSDSDATIGCDDLIAIDGDDDDDDDDVDDDDDRYDDDDELYLLSQEESVAEWEGADAEMVTV
ncbi:hypothetical protein CRV24_002399 [Beauveria bassiana]|nr:hypothetical protein CRV24_002399 [Beauveria bassiana]KAH8717761.1 hypothetical protein HC256_002439 [Beauveria bassiana]